MLATKFQMWALTGAESTPENSFWRLRLFFGGIAITHPRKSVSSLSIKYHEKVHIEQSEELSVVSNSHSFYFSPFVKLYGYLFIFHSICEFIKELHKCCLLIWIHSSATVKWLFSGLGKTISADVFHHCCSTSNANKRECSMSREFLFLGHPGRCSGPVNT